MTRQEETTSITIERAAQKAGLQIHVARHCVEVGLLDRELTEQDMAQLRRVRRLMALGVNLSGVEIILRMRRRIQELQAELMRLERRLHS